MAVNGNLSEGGSSIHEFLVKDMAAGGSTRLADLARPLSEGGDRGGAGPEEGSGCRPGNGTSIAEK